MKLKHIYGVLILLFSIQQGKYVHASHAAGADLTYECLGGQLYRFTLTFYRDCGGSPVPPLYNIRFSSSCHDTSLSVIAQGNPVDITPSCPIFSSTCSGGNNPGIEKHIYQGEINLFPCNDWIISFCDNARNVTINTITLPGVDNLCVQAFMDNSAGLCNNSPTFSNDPVAIICANNLFCLNHGAIDKDSDSLSFQLITPLNTHGGDSITYLPGFSFDQPLTSSPPASFNPATGDFCVTPTNQLNTVMALKVNEYRGGKLIGSVIRDMQIAVIICSNQLPILSGFDNLPASSQNTDTTVCIGTPLSLPITAFDPDLGDTLSISWNNAIDGASFSIFGTGDSAVFSWMPTSSDISNTPHCFTVTVADNGCPYRGTYTQSYCITVTGLSVSADDINANNCGLSPVTAGAEVMGGSGNYTYQWSTGETSDSITVSCGNKYYVTVSDNVSGCYGVDSTQVSCSSGSMKLQLTDSAPTCSKACDASISANVTGGTPPYSYMWFPNTNNSSNISNLCEGIYNLTVSDSNGCQKDTTIAVKAPEALSYIIDARSIDCINNEGNIRIDSISGGTLPYQYNWIPTGDTSSFISNLAAGNYFLTVTDANGCTDSTAVTITEDLPDFNITINKTPVLCSNECSGTATIESTIGDKLDQYTFLWTNSDTTVMATQLCEGIHQITITDTNGCSVVEMVNMLSPLPIEASIQASSEEICVGEEVVFSAFANGGTGNYSFSWSNGWLGEGPHTMSFQKSTCLTVMTNDTNNCSPVRDTFCVSVYSDLEIATLDQHIICEGQNLKLEAQVSGGKEEAHVITWSDDLGTGNEVVVSPPYVYPDTIKYAVTASDGCSLPVSSEISIQFHPKVEANYEYRASGHCDSLMVEFFSHSTANTINCYWDFGDGSGSADDCNAIQHVYTKPGSYFPGLTIYSPEGCVSKSERYELVIPGSPYANFTYDVIHDDIYQSVVAFHDLSTGNIDSWEWEFYDSISDNRIGESMLQHPVFDFSNQLDDTYFTAKVKLTVSDPIGCTDDTLIYIDLYPEPYIAVENTFTPNGDGINDFFFPKGVMINPHENFDMKIYDRWGGLLFQSASLNDPWDGTNGENIPVMEGVYVWMLKFTDISPRTKRYGPFIGHINVIR